MGTIANRLGIRITDGCLFPYTALTEKQSEMRPWNGPMDKEWLVDSRAMRVKRLEWLENDRGPVARVAPGKPFSVATADKDELLEYVANEYGESLDARLPILVLRRQTLALAQKQIDEQEAAEARSSAPEAGPQETVAADPATTTRARGLGRRAA